MGLAGAAGGAEAVDDAGEIGGVGDEAAEPEAVDEKQGVVDLAGGCGENVDLFRPVGSI